MLSDLSSVLILATTLSAIVIPTQADPNDWVNINYVLQEAKNVSPSSTIDAQNSIIFGAASTARRGPWSVTNSHGSVAPSGDPHDYLSWAPYHWPNCNWCGRGGTVHLVHSPNTTDDTRDDSDPPSETGRPDTTDPYPDGGLDNDVTESETVRNTIAQDASLKLVSKRRSVPASHRRTSRLKRSSVPIYNRDGIVLPDDDLDSLVSADDLALPPAVPVGGPPPLPTLPPIGSPTGTTQTSERIINGTPAPAQAPAKTQKGGRCTPSPTKSLAPSATWTTCPYVVRDGQVNPDVRTLNGPSAITGASQSIIYNAVAYALKQTSINCQNVAKFIDVFFLDPPTKMSPHMNYGQMVRGPGKAGLSGTFTGILDLRGIVKVINAIMLLKGSGCPEWTSARENGMREWVSQYSQWLEGSALGKSTASRANNHNTFYVSQLAATKLLLDDNTGAAATLQKYFTHQFLDQVAASGEQPFEAVRTRPFHYRCFNLEAMIVNAKLGDQLGLDFWSTKSKYGATIQTAVDYTMALNPKREDVGEIIPHVASVAAAYGDPEGKYAAFMTKTMANYQSKPFWFYDQTLALTSSPASKGERSTRSASWAREDGAPGPEMPFKAEDGEFTFECPAAFAFTPTIELDDDLCVTCEELKPYYVPSLMLSQ